MSVNQPKGHSVSDADLANFVKLPGVFTIATLPTELQVGQRGLLAYVSDGNGGAGGYYSLGASGVWNSVGGGASLSAGSGILISGSTISTDPAKAAQLLSQWGLPIFSASSCTMGANGAFTAHTAIPTALVGNCFLVVPAGYITSGQVAGVYAATFSSTTAGTIYQDTLPTIVLPAEPTFPASPVPWVGTAGSGTQITTVQPALTLTLPANWGKNTAIESRLRCVFSNTANAKTLLAVLGGTTILNQAFTSFATSQAIRTVQNVAATNRQLAFNASGTTDYGTSGLGSVSLALDTTTALNLVLSITLATATDFGGLYGGTLLSFYAP